MKPQNTQNRQKNIPDSIPSAYSAVLVHFDQISEAPDAVPRLRRFILDLAVRGKLVEQDPNDEPATELLKSIESERDRLIGEGKIRKREARSNIDVEEVPFDVPENWRLVRLGDALELINGRAFKPSEWSDSGLPIIRIQNLNNSDATFNYCGFSIPERYHVKPGDFLISWSGTPGTSFGAHIWDRGPAILNQHIFKAELIGDSFLPLFLKLAINSRLIELIEQAHGGAGLQHVTKPKLERLPLTLPPLAEQHRIVAKVDELMKLCDELEVAQQKREKRRDRLINGSLAKLTDETENKTILKFSVSSACSAVSRPEHIHQLRQTILNLAVRGKLVPQNPKDQPVEDLLKKIEAEKIRRIQTGVMRRHAVQIPVEEMNTPFKLPQLWEWCRLGDIIILVSGQHLQQFEYTDSSQDGIPYITGPADFDEKGLKITRYALIQKAVARQGEILLTVKGSGVGKSTICNLPEVAISRQLMAMDAIGWNQRFLLLVTHLLAIDLKQKSRSLIPGISREDVSQFVFALPPLAEQHRIVSKVDELMILCEEMESRLTTNMTTRYQLLEASLHEAQIH